MIKIIKCRVVFRRTTWLTLILRHDLIDKENQDAHVCELHFNPMEVDLTGGQPTLKKLTTPCFHLPIERKDKILQIISSDSDSESEEPRVRQEINHPLNDPATALGAKAAPVTNSVPPMTGSVPKPILLSDHSGSLGVISSVKSVANCNTVSVTPTYLASQSKPATPALHGVDWELTVGTPAPLSAELRKRKLKIDLESCNNKLQTKQSQACNVEKKVNLYNFQLLCQRFLPEVLASVAKMHSQLHVMGGEAFLTKAFTWDLYYSNPEIYRLCQNMLRLPPVSELRKVRDTISSQLTENFLVPIKSKLAIMSAREKECCMMVVAIELTPNLCYDVRRDRVVGLQEVDGVQSPAPARFALALSLRGLFVDWTLPVAYALLSECKSYDNISVWVSKIIVKLIEVGFKIRAFVSDFGSDVIKATVGKDHSITELHFEVLGKKIYHIVDVPHLIKQLCDAFKAYDLNFEGSRTAKYEHVSKFYEIDKTKRLRLVSKLTDKHIQRIGIDEMETYHAAQLFSKSLATGMSTYVDFNVIDESANDTIEFILMVNDMFDVLNSSTVAHECPTKRAYSGDNAQFEILNNIMGVFSHLKETKTNSENINDTTDFKFAELFVVTIQSLIALFEDLKTEGHKHLCTRYLQVENLAKFFKSIGVKSRRRRKPTSKQFVRAFQKLYGTFILKPPKDRKINSDYLQFVSKIYLKTTASFFEGNKEVEIVENEFKEISSEDYITVELPEKNSLMYICGWLMDKCKRRHNCPLLNFYIKDRHALGTLPEHFVAYVKAMEAEFCEAFGQVRLEQRFGRLLLERVGRLPFASPCPCFPVDFLRKLFVRLRIYTTVKYINKTLR